MPFTSGSSGPTTTMSICCSMHACLRAGKSFTPNGRLVPSWAVPGLPGAIHKPLQCGLAAIFQASACSRPPDPSNKIFIPNLFAAKVIRDDGLKPCLCSFFHSHISFFRKVTRNQQEQYCIHYHDTREQPEILCPRVLREKSAIGNAVVDQTNEDVPQ